MGELVSRIIATQTNETTISNIHIEAKTLSLQEAKHLDTHKHCRGIEIGATDQK